MSARTVDLTRTRRHLEVVEEWKTDHEEAMLCGELESCIEESLALFDMVQSTDGRVRRLAYLSPSDSSTQAEQIEETRRELASFYGRWLANSVRLLPALEDCEKNFEVVEGAGEFRRKIELARRTIAEGTAQARPRAPGMQLWEVTDDQAAVLQNLVTSPSGTQGTLSRKLQVMSAGDPSLIR